VQINLRESISRQFFGALYLELAHLFDERGALQVEHLGGARNYPVAAHQCLGHQTPLNLCEVGLEVNALGGQIYSLGVAVIECGRFNALAPVEQRQLQQQISNETALLVDAEYQQAARQSADIVVM